MIKLIQMKDVYLNDVRMPEESDIGEKFTLAYEGEQSAHSFNVLDFNDGLVSSYEKLATSGDKVVIIGGGYGVTAVRAARIVGEAGHVTIYEGGREQIEVVDKTIELNGVSALCETSHAIIGEEKVLYGNSDGADRIPPGELPDCDVLEMDCEGSELQILENLDIRPETLIVELHPKQYSDNIYKPLDKVREMGYELTHLVGQDGIKVDERGFKELLEKNRDMIGDHSPDRTGEKYLDSGARWPVVMGASLTEA
jgi:hypothetical protein